LNTIWNPRNYPIGSVVYFLETRDNKKYINYGIIEDHYPKTVCLQLIELIDVRTIDGIPYKDFVNNHIPSRWKKLPKGWSYDTVLWSIDEESVKKGREILKSIPSNYIKTPDLILDLYKKGILVNVQDNCHITLDTEIDKKEGWRIVDRFTDLGKPEHTSLNYWDVYGTYEEAKAAVKEYEDELYRQSKLSDFDWSYEQILHTLSQLPCTNELKQKYRNFLLAQGNIEEIETRISGGNLQWKYWKGKRWLNINLDN